MVGWRASKSGMRSFSRLAEEVPVEEEIPLEKVPNEESVEIDQLLDDLKLLALAGDADEHFDVREYLEADENLTTG
jgi:hypothetical protein